MKKALLVALSATLVAGVSAETKSVKIDFSKPADYGYTAPASNGATTDVAVGKKITSDKVDITVLQEGSTKNRFYNANGVVNFRLAKDGSIAVTANGQKLTRIELSGSNNVYSTNFSSNVEGWNSTTWEGNSDTVTLTCLKLAVQLSAMTVTYEVDASGNEEGPKVEDYVAVEDKVLASVFANAVADGARSIVSFGTDNMDVEAVGGRTPLRTAVKKGESFVEWGGYQEPEWKINSYNLRPAKSGVEAANFEYVVGVGNPVVEIGVSEPIQSNSSADTVFYDPTYVFYGPNDTVIGGKTYKHEMPKMGLYYRFIPKRDGELKVKVWCNKGNRNTYFVDEDTTLPVKYSAEGYVNNVSENVEFTMKDVNGKDSVGVIPSKKFLTAAQIDSVHFSIGGNFVADTVFVNPALTGEERVAAANIDHINKTDLRPYVIAGGNQVFVGWVVLQVKAGKKYWLFQDSSQIGFGGYTFTTEGASGIEEISSETSRQQGSQQIFDLTGNRVNQMTSGRMYIVNGRKQIIRR